MKTGFISDIHIDENSNYDILTDLATVVKQNKAQLLVIAGDISANAERTIKAVNELEQMSGVRTVFVPGNHDLWSEDFSRKSTDIIYERLCSDEHCLCMNPLKVGNKILIGDVGWYDYSFGNNQYSFEDFEEMRMNGRVWQDSIRNQWTKDNQGTCNRFLTRLESQMQLFPEEEQIIVTHMIPTAAFAVPEDHGDWAYFNAYLGSSRLAELYRRYKVKAAVCGHVHYRKNIVEDGIQYLCRCLNYKEEWRKEEGETCLEQINSAIEFMEL